MKLNLNLILITCIIICSCQEKEKDPQENESQRLPEVTTDQVIKITYKGATITGTIISDIQKTTSKGICIGKSENPTITSNTVVYDWNHLSFECTFENLSSNTTYFARAFATSTAGTGYGKQLQFNTLQDFTGQRGIVTDIDRNNYNTVGIGSQIWITENLKTTRYTDGTPIPNVTGFIAWGSTTTPAYCYYDNDLSNKSVYGNLYNWYALDLITKNKKLCPIGWHIPTSEEWNTLIIDLGEINAADDLRETGNLHWINNGSINTNTNKTGFNALPGGNRHSGGIFENLGSRGTIWESLIDKNGVLLPAYRYFGIDGTFMEASWNDDIKKRGCSVRCIKD